MATLDTLSPLHSTSNVPISATISPIHQPLPEWLQNLSFVPKNTRSPPIPPPTRKRRRSSTKRIPRESVNHERARQLERNRVAANKCRIKKKEEQEKMEQLVEKVSEKRDSLISEVNCLRNQIWRLKNDMFAHVECGDGEVLQQLQRMAQDIFSGYRKSSSVSSTLLAQVAEPLLVVSLDGLAASERPSEEASDDALFKDFLEL